MSIINLIDNRRAYEYNKAISHKLKAVCQPFMDNADATEVAYHRIYYNGDAVSVATNSDILKHYFLYVQEKGLFFQKHLSQIEEDKFFYFLWPNQVENSLHEIIQQIGVWNGFNLYIRRKDYIENFVFMSNLSSMVMQNYCINNLDLINSFVGYFKEKAHEFIYNLDCKDMAFFNCSTTLINTSAKTQSFPMLNMQKVPFYLESEKIYLTSREALCLSFIGFGYSTKNIASTLNLSPRTVEQHIGNIRIKANDLYKAKFIDLIHLPENAIIKNLKSLYENELKI